MTDTTIFLQVSKPKGGVKESVPDFFSDMEPVIPKAKNLLEQGPNSIEKVCLKMLEILF